MNQMRILACAIALSAFASGCRYGIMRTAHLESLPSKQCVEDALRSVSGIVETSSRDFFPQGSRHYHVLYWTFHPNGILDARNGLSGILMVSDHVDDGLKITHRVDYPRKQPDVLLCAFRPKMDEIERAIADRCNVRELLSNREERLKRTQCE